MDFLFELNLIHVLLIGAVWFLWSGSQDKPHDNHTAGSGTYSDFGNADLGPTYISTGNCGSDSGSTSGIDLGDCSAGG